jgi:ribose transport system permease protein
VTSTATEPRPVGRLEERGVQQTALPRRARVARALAPDVIGGLYVLVAMIILFSVWVPETFPNWDTARQILNNNSVRALAALALVIPLSAGVFDISVANTMTLSGVMCTYTIVHTDIPIWGAVLIGMLTAVGVGVVNAVVVVVAKIDSLIGTLPHPGRHHVADR